MDRTPCGMMGVSASVALGETRAAETQARPTPFPLVELRQYRTYPGKRDTLVALFEREFVESQEALGMQVLGTFRQPSQPDRFVWLRGFADMAARAKGLNAFYSGPVWREHSRAANATMEDSDDVLLLREARPGSGFAGEDGARSAPDAAASPGGPVVAVIDYPEDEAAYATAFAHQTRPRLAAAGTPVIAEFVREKAANNFPRLPIRADEDVFVWFAKFNDQASYRRVQGRLREILRTQGAGLAKASDVLVLAPTAGSQLRG